MNNNSNMNKQNQSNSAMSSSAQSMNSNAQQQNGMSSAQIDSNIEAYKKAHQNLSQGSNQNSMQ